MVDLAVMDVVFLRHPLRAGLIDVTLLSPPRMRFLSWDGITNGEIEDIARKGAEGSVIIMLWGRPRRASQMTKEVSTRDHEQEAQEVT